MATLKDRKETIARLVNSYIRAHDEGKEVDEEKLIALLGADVGVSRRTAKEYIASAKAKASVVLNERYKQEEKGA